MSEKPGKIYAAMAAIMADVAPIAKDRRNDVQKFNFRGIDDIYNELNHIMAKHGVVALPTLLSERTEERESKSGGRNIWRLLTIRYDFYASDGSSVPATVLGEGMDSADKGSNKAMSAADKYALLQAFKIPTAEPRDSEAHEQTRSTAEAALDRPPARYIKMLGAFVDDLGWKEADVLKKIGKASWKDMNDQDYEKARALYDEETRKG